MAEEGDDTRNECHSLLVSLRSTVEGLLGNQATNVWNTYGGLSRLTNVVNKILRHCLKQDQGRNTDCWNFILGLRVLIPTIAPWLERHRLATEGCSDRGYLWLQQRLQEHTLSSYLKVLLDDSNHLKTSYRVGAFLRQEGYGDSLLKCLKAVENNRLSLLTELDPNLLVDQAAPLRPRANMRRPSLPSNMGEISLQSHVPTEIRYYIESVGPKGGNGHLHRAQPVDPSRASYHRERCCNRRRLKSDFERTGAIPKSTTWDGSLVWDPSLYSESSDCQTAPKPKTAHSTRRLSKSCICLSQSKTENSRSVRGTRKRNHVTKSLPCILNSDNISLENIKANLKGPCEVSGRTETFQQGHSADQSNTSPICKQGLANDQLRNPADSLDVKVSPEEVRVPLVRRSPTHSRSKSDIGVGHHVYLDKNKKQTEVNSQLLCTVPMSCSLPANLQSDTELNGPSFEEEYPMPIFRRPVEGQSLTSFLSSQDFRTCAELDKENAHFSISEALISAIEQIKCNQMLKIAEEEDEESDDEEIKHLKQRIRIRRRERLQEKVTFRSPHLLSDGCTDTTTTTTTSRTPSPPSTSSDNKSEGNSSDSVDPIDLSDGSEMDTKLSTLDESGLSLSMASLYSDADIQRPIGTTQLLAPHQDLSDKSAAMAESMVSYASAESVALNLLRKFSEKQLPKASDLEWLVSEQDAPQKLLPLPTSWPVSPDDADNIRHPIQTRLRGNLEWAPPRQQIIFNVHPTPQRKVIMAKQNYRCAGCGTKVEKGFVKRFRYCEYLGKYFCQCCHNNNLAYIPGRILRKWDFNKYYVSNFSRDLLKKMSQDPLYDISDINPSLYRRVKALHQVLQYRQQLLHIKDFIHVCRKCEGMAEEFEKQPSHLFVYTHLYSLHELVQVKTGEMLNKLRPLVTQALMHIAQCEVIGNKFRNNSP